MNVEQKAPGTNAWMAEVLRGAASQIEILGKVSYVDHLRSIAAYLDTRALEQPEGREAVADPEPPSNEVWPPDGAVWLAPVATDAPANPKLMQYAWGRSGLSSGQMAEAYQCIVSAAQECGQVYRLPVTTPPAKVPEGYVLVRRASVDEAIASLESPVGCYVGAVAKGLRAMLAAAQQPKEGVAQETAARPTDDELWDKTLQDRDRYEEMADQLAEQIAAITGQDIGEHSSANCPWQNAMLAADEYLASRFKRQVFGNPNTPHQPEARVGGEVAVCCGRSECGGECGNEWRGTTSQIEALIVAMAENYEMVCDEGYYQPNEHERLMLVDFAHEVAEAIERDYTTPPPSAVPEGWRLVRLPNGNTKLTKNGIGDYSKIEVREGHLLHEFFSAMLAAAPEPKEG